MLARMLGPKEADLCLLWRPHGAVDRPESLYLVVVVDPFLAVERIRALVREKLLCT